MATGNPPDPEAASAEEELEYSQDDFDGWVEAVQNDVAYCATCQSYDSGECIWIFGDEMSWDDIFNDCEVPDDEDLREKIASQISCPHCGAGLDITCTVGVKSDVELATDDLWDRWYKTYHYRFEDLHDHLAQFPYLGLLHDLGAELQAAIGKFPKSTLAAGQWHRAREVSSSALLTADMLRPPDPSAVPIPEGRYNHFGQRAFYLAEHKEGAAREVLGDQGGIVWVQIFDLEDTSDILDLAPHERAMDDPEPDIDLLSFGLMHARVLEREVQRTAGWKPEYFVPRLIADCARQSGFKGIRFRSTKHYGRNLVLFNWIEERVKASGVPQILTVPAALPNPHFPSINDPSVPSTGSLLLPD